MLDGIRELIIRGDLDDALIKIEQSDENELDLKLLKSITLRRKESFNAALSTAQETLQDSKDQDSTIHQLGALTQIAYVLMITHRLKESQEYVLEFEKIWETLSDQDKNQAIEWQGYYYNVKGGYNSLNGNYQKALSLLKKSIEIRKQHKIKLGLQSSIHNLSIAYYHLGNYNNSIDACKEGIKFAQEVGNESSVGYTNEQLGLSYAIQGKYDLARECFTKTIEIGEKFNNRYASAGGNTGLGKLSYLEGDYDSAQKNLTKALSVFQDLNMVIYVAENLYNLILTSIKLKSDKQIANYLNRIQSLDDKSQNKRIHLITQLSKGVVLKNNPRSKFKAEAQQIFEDIHHEDGHVQISIDASLNLVEILLDELKLYGGEEVLDEITHLTENLRVRAQKNLLYPLIIDTLILQSKLAFVKQDVDLAYTLLQEARQIAEEQNLDIFHKKVLEEELKLEEELAIAKEILRSSPTLAERLDKSEIIRYIHDMQAMLRISQ
ncbi:MAG: tetratricopeptide repeat protein [Candidatus Kariarchaeaceae archaeon]|jgi:tetratricopeptide (TPR) repeat protein